MRPSAAFLLAILFAFSACRPDDPVAEAVHRAADSLIAVRPDSALLLLQALDTGSADGDGSIQRAEAARPSSWPRRQRMRHELLRARAMNKAYVDFTTDSVMKEVAAYYDRHGSPNERMEAHYLLGCAYRDLGEAPRAIDCYLDATACADTTATDCDYQLLFRIYAQMAGLFFQQNLTNNCLESIGKSCLYAEKAADTLSAMNMRAYSMAVYERMAMPDKVLQIYDQVFDWYGKRGYIQEAASYSFLAIGSYLQKGKNKEARACLKFYEEHSGFFKADGNIGEGREIYYSLRGRYHLATQEYDSASYFFRKGLTYGKDFNNQNAASRGLAQTYMKTGRPDSAAFYSLYSYEMNDSIYARMATDEVERACRMYDYTRHQRIAQQEKERADTERNKFLIALFIITGIVSVAGLFIRHLIVSRRKDRKRYAVASQRLNEVKAELKKLQEQKRVLDELKVTMEAKEEDLERRWRDTIRKQESELVELMQSKEAEIKKLNAELELFRERKSDTGRNLSMANSEAHNIIARILVAKRGKMDEGQWKLLEEQIANEMPGFHQFLDTHKYRIGITGYRVCLMLRLSVRVKDIANVLEVKPAYISKVSTSVLWQLWNVAGSSKELRKKLNEI